MDEFCAQLLADLEANGILVGQLHAEYGLAQMELAIGASDPVAAADLQLLTRQTIHAAARRHGLRASFAPLVDAAAAGNGWHIHSSVSRDGAQPALGRRRRARDDGRGRGVGGGTAARAAGAGGRRGAERAIAAAPPAGLLRERVRVLGRAEPGGGAAPHPRRPLVPAGAANVELKASDASGNPYLAVAAVIAAGLAGIAEGLTLPEPVKDDPGAWDGGRAGAPRHPPLPRTADEAIAAVEGSAPVPKRWATTSSGPGRPCAAATRAGRGQDARRDRRAPPLDLLMLGAETRLLPHAAELARLHAQELPQKDELCGAFNTLLTLRLAGIGVGGDEAFDQDTVGQAAGSVLGPEGYEDDLPPGEAGRTDYRLEHPRAAAEIAGTSAGGLVRAVAELSAGRRVAVGLTGPWNAGTLERLLEIAQAEKDAALVLNVGTRFFWGSRPSVAELLAYLESGDDTAGPAPTGPSGTSSGASASCTARAAGS